jgi:YVTN family beta-propeller protein
MWAGPVVMVEVLVQDLDQVALAEDDQPVQTLSPQGAQYPLAGGICAGSAEWGSGDPDAGSGEDRVEVRVVLRVAVADQHRDRDLQLLQFPGHVSCLLRYPSRIGMGGGIAEVSAFAAELCIRPGPLTPVMGSLSPGSFRKTHPILVRFLLTHKVEVRLRQGVTGVRVPDTGRFPDQRSPRLHIARHTRRRYGLLMALTVLASLGAPGLAFRPAQAAQAFNAYVTDEGMGTVTPFNTVTGALGTPISPGTLPLDPVITPDGRTLLVGSAGIPTVSLIDTATNTVRATVPISFTDPQSVDIAITPDGSTAYTFGPNRSLLPIDIATGTAGAPIPFAPGPNDNQSCLAITPNGRTAVISTFSSIVQVDLATLTSSTPIPLGGSPCRRIAITPDSTTAFASETNFHQVLPINLISNTLGSPISVTAPIDLTMTKDGKTVYVLGVTPNSSNPNVSDIEVTPLDVATHTLGTPIIVLSTPLAVANSIALTPDGMTAYVTVIVFINNPSTVAQPELIPINLASRTAGPPILLPPSNGFQDLAISPIVSSPTPSPSPTMSPSPTPTPNGLVPYVALGDSFSSGDGTGFYYDDLCRRSFGAWPYQLLGTGPTPRFNLDLPKANMVACTGATTNGLTLNGKPAGGVTGSNTADISIESQLTDHFPSTYLHSLRLITVTAGGDDLGILGIVATCLFAGYIESVTGTTLAHQICTSNEPTPARWNALRSALTALYRFIHQEAPQATILVVGYPDVIPTSAHRSIQNNLLCAGLGQTEAIELNKVLLKLNGVAQQSVADAGVPGLQYVHNTWNALTDDERLCGSRSMINGLNISDLPLVLPYEEECLSGDVDIRVWSCMRDWAKVIPRTPGHPDADAYGKIADRVGQYISGHPI